MQRWVLVVFLLAALAAPLSGQNGPKNRNEWRAYSADPGSSKYSPLDQINRDNAKNLRVAWRFKTENHGPRPNYNSQVDAARGQRRHVRAGGYAPRRRRHRAHQR